MHLSELTLPDIFPPRRVTAKKSRVKSGLRLELLQKLHGMRIASTRTFYAMYPDYPENTIRKALLALERGGHIDKITPSVLEDPKPGRQYETYASLSTHNAKLKDPFKRHSKMISEICGVAHIGARLFDYPLHSSFLEPPGERRKS